MTEEKYEDLIGADVLVICEGCKRVLGFDEVNDENYCATCLTNQLPSDEELATTEDTGELTKWYQEPTWTFPH